MKISSILKQNEKGVAFEFFPPKSERGKQRLLNTYGSLKNQKPLYVSMTCGAGGGSHEWTEDAVYELLKDQDLTVMPHLTCVSMEMNQVKSLLDKYKEKGVENIMALRGDPPEGDDNFCFLEKDFSYGKDLVSFIKKEGDFCVGVAVYPEGHIETSSLDDDMNYTKQKIDSGADFAVTQMFFDNNYYYALLDRMEKNNITIPVLPGILPLTDVSKVKQFASICRTTVPKHIEETMARYKNNPADMEKVGIEFTIKQCQDLIKNGAQKLHFFTLNKSKVLEQIIVAL
ncbi:MAG: methylenetetrahydrofolate reductase [NAD(P)H] [Candidatus Omnitrophica bacterium]|nr:methylenetetrahydrofolate reductase [NAD(P)H] [Candidatus Omnitrophota bacterium]